MFLFLTFRMRFFNSVFVYCKICFIDVVVVWMYFFCVLIFVFVCVFCWINFLNLLY